MMRDETFYGDFLSQKAYTAEIYMYEPYRCSLLALSIEFFLLLAFDQIKPVYDKLVSMINLVSLTAPNIYKRRHPWTHWRGRIRGV